MEGDARDDVITTKGVIKTMITNSLGILGARANAECLEDRLGIMVGDGKAAFGRRRSADAANRVQTLGKVNR